MSAPEPVTIKFSNKIIYGASRITGSGRTTSPFPALDKKGKLRRYAIEMWLLREARIEASGNAVASAILADVHAHNMKDADFEAVNTILEFGVFPDFLKKL